MSEGQTNPAFEVTHDDSPPDYAPPAPPAEAADQPQNPDPQGPGRLAPPPTATVETFPPPNDKPVEPKPEPFQENKPEPRLPPPENKQPLDGPQGGQINEKNDKEDDPIDPEEPERAVWGNQIEFLMSCIATSVGLGNVWRFPFIAFQNGGGAFLIPYIIVLLLLGKPMYYLECILGQFSSKSTVQVWAMVPAMKGLGYAQLMASGYVLSYYVPIVALCIFYFAMSFSTTLPWAVCQEEWGPTCVPSDPSLATSSVPVTNGTSSAELYFVNTVLRQRDGIEGGLGAPLWDLSLCLLAAWFVVFVIVVRGVRSSGKASYFLALFPYVIMFILLIRATTLEGAGTGILFFLTPQWERLTEIRVWYNAVTQMFFSLSVSMGTIIMFSSYNGFKQNVYRDAMIVTTLDTFTSLLSGITIFGVLGNLAFELGYDDINDVINSGGTGLAFISYPDAIAKSPFVPQLFAVLFFLMMAVLGIGSAVALLSTVNTVMMDSFPRVPTMVMSAICCTSGFLIGLTFVTPGGQYILELVDYYGGTFLVLFGAIVEIIAVMWIYGLENLCLDIEYMLGIKTSVYWRFCWGIIMHVFMIGVFIYALISFEALVFGDGYVYPSEAYVAGYVMLFAGISLVPIFLFITLYKNRTGNFMKTVKKSFSPKESWGPRDKNERRGWIAFKEEAREQREKMGKSKLQHYGMVLIGGYRRGR